MLTMDKQVYELGPNDFIENPVWIFPMDDTVEDEETVRPVRNESQLEDLRVIVRTDFVDQTGRTYLGYIYWGEPVTVEYLHPVIFLDDSGESGMFFYKGMFEPEDSDFDHAKGILSIESFPIKFESEEFFGLYPIRGELKGIYYLDEDNNIRYKVIP